LLGTVTSSGTEATMRIGDAAEAAGVSSRTLRFYEELGLVCPSGHTAGGARRYAPGDLARIERIQELKEVLGLGLDEIKDVLDAEARLEQLRDAYRENARVSTASARLRQKAILTEALQRREAITEQLDRKMARMAAFRARLHAEADRTRELLDHFDAGAE
jgi:DNA-binding transcriptional MerR regulator